MRGLTWNQLNNPNFIYKNDQRKKIDTFKDFENKTPTRMDSTYAISKSERNFQNRFPRELDENFDTLESAWWTESVPILWKEKKRLRKKVIPIFNPGIQPTDDT